MTRHTADTDLALYSAGDLALWLRPQVWLHVRTCASCRSKVESFRADRAQRLAKAGQLPEGLDWDRMAEEMTANIHLGLAAGECVAPRSRRSQWKQSGQWGVPWRPAAVAAGLVVVITAAWWLNMPQSDNEALSRVVRGIIHGGRRPGITSRGVLAEDNGPVVEATSAGVELRENGGALQVSESGQHPLTVSVSVQGSASAHYIDTDTGQMTITTVYAQ